MADVWSQSSQQSSRASMMWNTDESPSQNMSDFSPSPDLEEVRPIRRVRSPSTPRAWSSGFYKPQHKGRFYKHGYTTRGYSSHKSRAGSQKHHHFSNREYMDRKEYYPLKLPHRKWEREKEKSWYQSRGSPGPRSAPKPSSATRTGSPWSSSSTDKNKKRTRKLDQRKTSSKERGQSRDSEPPETVSSTTARDRAIQKKRREIDEVYYQECEMFGLVTKMLIQKDRSLELLIQSALQENLRDIGRRCVEAMEKFIEDYDSQH
ncbi:periphilin-1-like isoform X2 [Cynoglossus semilaevis]|uniref:Periphilin-1-like n=1 Tax=Cynoglossus semilaevis TaxID=244447 RepID=A0A3P8X3A7_CYNSE|nr:periphilin-1-like isoform X2 [Cynoglossus semilaevis]